MLAAGEHSLHNHHILISYGTLRRQVDYPIADEMLSCGLAENTLLLLIELSAE